MNRHAIVIGRHSPRASLTVSRENPHDRPPMSRAIVLQHVPHEGPGRIIPVFRDFGIPTDVRKLWAGDEVPSDLDDIRCLIVLGGPMGVADVGKAEYPWLTQEVELLKRMVAA